MNVQSRICIAQNGQFDVVAFNTWYSEDRPLFSENKSVAGTLLGILRIIRRAE